jgi:ComF family protein
MRFPALPAACVGCARWPSEPLCQECRGAFARLQPRCPGCALPLAEGLSLCTTCTRKPEPALDQCCARVSYQYPWTTLLARLKFQGEPAQARLLGALMAQITELPGLLHQATHVAPIPLAPARLRARGYNQAWELLQAMHRTAATHAPGGFSGVCTPQLLERADTSLVQHKLSGAEREANMAGAFQIGAAWQGQLEGARIVLVDDVMTTGNTLRTAAQLLRDNGASFVAAVVLARTPAPEQAHLDQLPSPDDDLP